jgi:hypothetical protein
LLGLSSARGGSFRISLTDDDPIRTEKTAARTDTYHARFVKLVPNAQVVEVIEFETTDGGEEIDVDPRPLRSSSM